MKYTAQELSNWSTTRRTDSGEWKPARPLNYHVDTIRQRVRDAWAVLTGKMDALDWEENS